jgi:hypothetical protein
MLDAWDDSESRRRPALEPKQQRARTHPRTSSVTVAGTMTKGEAHTIVASSRLSFAQR